MIKWHIKQFLWLLNLTQIFFSSPESSHISKTTATVHFYCNIKTKLQISTSTFLLEIHFLLNADSWAHNLHNFQASSRNCCVPPLGGSMVPCLCVAWRHLSPAELDGKSHSFFTRVEKCRNCGQEGNLKQTTPAHTFAELPLTENYTLLLEQNCWWESRNVIFAYKHSLKNGPLLLDLTRETAE